ncbi:MAG: signal recognition particle-docking protein FtsY [Pigmentiphaga sp.]
MEPPVAPAPPAPAPASAPVTPPPVTPTKPSEPQESQPSTAHGVAAPAAPSVPVEPPPATPAPSVPPLRPTARAAAPTVVGGIPAERPGNGARSHPLMPQAAAAEPAAEQPARKSWLTRLKTGLSRTGQNFTGLFVNVKVDENLFEELETALIMADAGVESTEALLTALRARVRKERIEDGARVKEVLRELLTEHLKPLQRGFDVERATPLVVMIAGVNGAGKTTSIGKLARAFQAAGRPVLLAAGDTFRAAAREQLVEWGRRNEVAVIAQAEGGDPAAVAFDAVQAGRARGMGVVMIDTAGRLPTQLHLMAELQKIRKVIGKADEGAPHEVLLVIDGNTGQNALAQIKAFDEALGLTGLVVTKLDGTARGGILAAVAAGSHGVRPVPVYWIGVGEAIEDLQPFVASEFAGAMLGD